MNIHRSEERGESNSGWLQSRFSFSFANYFNPARMGFGALRVLNDDIIAPSAGFGAHPHDNMEIISIPISGKLAHKDSTGSEEIVHNDEVQVMSAGSGVVHSEYNASDCEVAKFLQIWITTNERNINPRHEKKKIILEKNKLAVVASGYDDGSCYIHQNAKLSLGEFAAGQEFAYEFGEHLGVFVFVMSGSVSINGEELHERDSAEITDSPVTIKTTSECKILIIEVPVI